MPDKKLYDKARHDIYSYICMDHIGPKKGDYEELNNENPVQYYSAGILFPQKTQVSKEESGEENVKNARTGKADDGEEDLPVGLENEYYPSAMGISFYLESQDPKIKVIVKTGLYKAIEIEEKSKKKKKKKPDSYKREPFNNSSAPLILTTKDVRINLIAGLAALRIKWRKRQNNLFLTTVTLINLSKTPEDELPDPEKCLFQCSIEVQPADEETKFIPFENFGFYSPDEEKIMLEIMYRKKKPYSVGHGVSADWEMSKTKQRIFTSIYPLAEISPVDFEIKYYKNEEIVQRALSIKYLSELSEENKKDVIHSLNSFANNYNEWIDNLKKENDDIAKTLSSIVEKQVKNCKSTYKRMIEGIELIEKDNDVLDAFTLANRAMLMQLKHTSEIRKLKQNKIISIDQVNYDDLHEEIKWRPFQLGFFLLAIPSIVSGKDRELLDLIWFPTGGGKTEAYLALSSFTIIYLRMKKGEAATGTNVLTRYTLRALTTQQFQRSATLICALEKIRKQNPKKLGREKISLGLFVGSSSTPNTVSRRYKDDDTCAKDIFDRIEQPGNYKNPFPLQNCPWCNQEIIPKGSFSNSEWGIRITDELFEFFCPNTECDFHEFLPLNIVDEMIYKNPPSMLVGTIDKFARLTWEPKMYTIFGEGKKIPPALIIQDELHLISGPLGSIMGIYETIIDELCTDKNGIKAKIIASTATTRNSVEQCRALFNREAKLFPPPGLDADDSFFAKTKNEEGRLYCGILNPGKSGLTSTLRLFAALLQGVHEIPMDDDVRDNYYTLVAYYNSLRELGKNLTLAVDDIPDRMGLIANNTIRDFNNIEFSSKIPSEDIPDIIERLKLRKGSRGFIDFLLATNMISVGIDINRLGLMTVVGQPKTAAEYIQATSRIGRVNPGLIIVLFSPTKIRDRSHYEKFKAFHDVFYKEVEPSGVTPFSKQVIERAIHALLIIMARQYEELKDNSNAGNFRKEHEVVNKIKVILQNRINNIEPESLNFAYHELEGFANEFWENQALQYGGALRYSKGRGTNQFHQLIKDFASVNKEGRGTLNSFRNVDYDIKMTEINLIGGE